MALEKTPVYGFGPFTLDPARRLLARDGRPVSLTARVFDTLLVLVEGHGRVVPKQELMDRVWKDTFVEEGSLTQTISVLRHALGDGENGHRIIATVTRRGYAFVAPVSESIATGAAPASPAASPPPEGISPTAGPGRRGATLVLGLVAACALAVGTFWLVRPRSPAPIAGVRSIAVLPFRPLKADDPDAFLGLALADSIITRLGRLRGVSVRPTGAVAAYAATREDPIAAGRALQVDAVLDGQVQETGDRVRVTAQLVDVSRRSPLWSQTIDVPRTDLFAIEDSVSEAVERELTGARSAPPARRVSPAAYEAYLRGRYYWNRCTEDSLRRAQRLFREAIDADPTYARAWAGLADAHNVVGEHLEAADAARRALDLDPSLGEAHAALGNVALFHDFDVDAAQREFARAIAANPSCAEAYQWRAYGLAAVGRFADAQAAIENARALDPLSLSIQTDVGDILYYARRYPEAEREIRRALDMDPHFAEAHLVLASIFQETGRAREAVAELETADRRDQFARTYAPALARAYALAGQPDRARAIETSFPDGYCPACRARILAALGERDRAFEQLDAALRERFGPLILLGVDPQFDPLRSDPRFAGLLGRLRLPA